MILNYTVKDFMPSKLITFLRQITVEVADGSSLKNKISAFKGGLNTKLICSTFIFLGFLNATSSDPLIEASAALNAGLYEKALKHAKQAKKENPNNPDVYKMIALLYESLGKPSKAIVAWEKCLMHSNRSDQKKEAQNHIDILKNEL